MHVAAYIRQLGKKYEKPTVKQHLAAIRMLFDWLVVGQVIAINPAHSVRGPKHAIKRGKTPVLTPDEARKLLDSIDVTTAVGLRDRALIGMMAYSFARVSAVVSMRVEDYYSAGKRWWVRLHEKGGKRHEMPCHHSLEAYLDAYLQVAKILEAKKSPLFRSARGRTGELTESPMSRIDMWRMIRRRAIDACLSADICCHTFRATGITAYLENGGTLENAQLMAAHESPRTTKLYDRTGDEITLDEVERIVILILSARSQRSGKAAFFPIDLMIKNQRRAILSAGFPAYVSKNTVSLGCYPWLYLTPLWLPSSAVPYGFCCFAPLSQLARAAFSTT